MEAVINQQKVQLPVIINDLPNNYYHSLDCIGVSKSDLDKISRSKLHYLYSKSKSSKSTPAMILGSLVHSLVLEPQNTHKEFACLPDIDKRTKQGKDDYALFMELAGSKSVVSSEDYTLACQMSEAIESSTTAKILLKGSIVESSAFVVDQETGVIKKCRPDAVRPDLGIIIDIKTVADDCSFNEFRRTIVTRGYDKQAAYYLDTYSEASGIKYDTFVFICVEKAEPHGVAIYSLNEAALDAGRALYRRDILKYKESQSIAPENFGYPDMVQEIDIAAYGFDIASR